MLITFAAWEDNPNFSMKKTLKLGRLHVYLRESYSFIQKLKTKLRGIKITLAGHGGYTSVIQYWAGRIKTTAT